MKYKLSKDFGKSLERLGGKELRAVLNMLDEVEQAATIDSITDCRKLTNYTNVYRIRIGGKRAFFTLHLEILEGLIFFRYLVSRGQAYNKAMEANLRRIDKEM